MSILPAFEAVLSDGLSDQEADKVLTSIKGMKGVLSAAFHECCGKCDHCAKEKSIRVTYVDSERVFSIQQDVAKLPGVAKIKPLM